VNHRQRAKNLARINGLRTSFGAEFSTVKTRSRSEAFRVAYRVFGEPRTIDGYYDAMWVLQDGTRVTITGPCIRIS